MKDTRRFQVYALKLPRLCRSYHRVPPPPQTRDYMIALPSLSREARQLRASPALHHLYSGPLAAPPTPHHSRHPLSPHPCADRASPAQPNALARSPLLFALRVEPVWCAKQGHSGGVRGGREAIQGEVLPEEGCIYQNRV